MINVSIPKFSQVEGEDERPFTVYHVNVRVAGRSHIIDRRYREFHSLHKQMKRNIETPDFPPKKVLQLSARGLEQRRQALENYLQGILSAGTVPKSLLTFLKIQHFKSSSFDSLDDLGTDSSSSSSHQPILIYDSDPFLIPSPEGSTDILVEGVHQGLYSDPDSSTSSN